MLLLSFAISRAADGMVAIPVVVMYVSEFVDTLFEQVSTTMVFVVLANICLQNKLRSHNMAENQRVSQTCLRLLSRRGRVHSA